MDVLVIRHAIALARDEAVGASLPDEDRPLTRQGRSRMRRVARCIARRVPDLSRVLTSPLRRAVETAEMVTAEYAGLEMGESDGLRPDSDVGELARALAEFSPHSMVAVVGHEPHLSSWVSWALTGEVRNILQLRKAGTCYVRFEGHPGPACGRLLWLLTPGLARRLV